MSSERQRDERERDEHSLGVVLRVGALGWLAWIVLLTAVRGGSVTPDLLLIFAGLVAVAALAHRRTWRHLLPFPLIVLAWEAMRGLASDLPARVHLVDVVAIERSLFGGLTGGETPGEWLQRIFHTGSGISPADVLLTAVYLGHFVVPVAIGVVLWRWSATVFDRYAIAMIVVALAGYATQLVFPVAPPRLAATFGVPLAVHDVVSQVVTGGQGLPLAAWGYGNLWGNQLAAFPSLHAAYPLVGSYFLARLDRRAAWISLAWTALIWFAIVYLAQHFLVDALLGAAYAGAACVVTELALGRAAEAGRHLPVAADE